MVKVLTLSTHFFHAPLIYYYFNAHPGLLVSIRYWWWQSFKFVWENCLMLARHGQNSGTQTNLWWPQLMQVCLFSVTLLVQFYVQMWSESERNAYTASITVYTSSLACNEDELILYYLLKVFCLSLTFIFDESNFIWFCEDKDLIFHHNFMISWKTVEIS